MKAIVAVKRVVDHNVQVRVKTDKTGVETQNLKMSMNPFDENAIEEAIKFKESGIISEVIVVSIGPDKCYETLQTALAMGSDRGIHVLSNEECEPLVVAKILKQIVLKENPDIVFTGKQAIDFDNNQTAQMLAALLGWAQAICVSKIAINNAKNINVVCEIEDRVETISLFTPVVISVDLHLNNPRYVSLSNIIRAKKKPLERLNCNDLGIDIQPRLTTIEVVSPPQKQTGIRIDSVSELIDKLRNEAEVI